MSAPVTVAMRAELGVKRGCDGGGKRGCPCLHGEGGGGASDSDSDSATMREREGREAKKWWPGGDEGGGEAVEEARGGR